MSPRPAVDTHPLVHAYLADLERALAGADPRERADVLDGVREHLDEALGQRGPAATADVRRVLADLGPVEAIAAQATRAEQPSPAAVASPVVAPASDTTSLVALITSIAAAALVFIPFVSIPLAVAALVTAAVHLRSPGARKGRCWAAVAVASVPLLLVALAASALLAVGTTDGAPGPIQTATSLTSVPAG